MAGDEGEDAGESGDEACAPTCRRCLAIMDKFFPEPVLHDRFALIVQIITHTVAEHGYAEMRNVPGDQQAALRKQVRSAVRQRTGHGSGALFTRAWPCLSASRSASSTPPSTHVRRLRL